MFVTETKENLTPTEEANLYSIWNEVYPEPVVFNETALFKAYLNRASRQSHYLVKSRQGEVAGWLMVFDRDGGRNFVMLVDSKFQGRGIGRLLLEKAIEKERRLIGWAVTSNEYRKRDGSTYRSPIEFYQKLGFDITNESMQKGNFSVVKIVWKKP